MSFANGRACRTVTHRQRRLSRAQWWFQRMRQVVEGAMDWHAAPPPRPEQIWLPGARRDVSLVAASVTKRVEDATRQICE